MKLLAVSDLCVRWNYTKAGIHNLVKSKDFPLPVASVCKGRIKIFSEENILIYESTRPWLFDESQKIQRQKFYARLQLAKENVEPNLILKKIFGENAKVWKS